MDNFNLPRQPAAPAATPAGLGAKQPASAPSESAPGAGQTPGTPLAPATRLTGDLNAFAEVKTNRLQAAAASPAVEDAMPWESPAFAQPESATPTPTATAASALTAQKKAELAMNWNIPIQPQSATPLLNAVPPTRPTTSGPGSLAALKATQKELAEAIEAQLANPDLIAQFPGKGTCVAATIQKTLARQNARLYAMVASELAVNGNAQLPNGQKLVVSPANLRWIESQGLFGAKKLNALMQCALMELGAPGQGYHLSSDSFMANPTKPPGLSLDQARRLIEGLLKTPLLDPRELKSKWDEHHLAAGMAPPEDPLKSNPTPELARKLLKGAEAGAFAVVRSRDDNGELLRDAEGRPLVEGLEDEEAQPKRPPKRSHMVQIIAVDQEAGTVTFIDGLGTQKTLPATTFARIMLMSTRADELEGIGSPTGAAL